MGVGAVVETVTVKVSVTLVRLRGARPSTQRPSVAVTVMVAVPSAFPESRRVEFPKRYVVATEVSLDVAE